MKILKKIISIITVVVVLVSSLLWLVPTASAAEIDGVEYQYKLSRDVSIIPSEFIASLEIDPTQDVLFLENVTINISNGMSGTGEIGYNAAANSFYVYIYKYGVEGAYWALKYDSSGQWKYRGSADDYTNDSSNYYNYNDSATDIYFAINKENYDLIFTAFGIAEDVSTSAIEWTAYFYNGDELFTTKNTTGTLVMPTPTIDKAGYSWKGWTDGTNTYQAGQTVTIHSSMVYHAVWEANAVEWTAYFYNGDELFTTKNTTGTLVMPTPTIDKAGYSWKGWTDGTNTYQAGQTVTIHSSMVYHAVWEYTGSFSEVTFKGEGIETFTINTDINGIVTMPALPEGASRDGYRFVGWTEGAYIYTVGMTYDCVTKDNYTFTAVWEEVTVGIDPDTGTDENGKNFIVSFIFDTYDGLKETIMPYFNDFEIPFLNITLADVVSFLFFGAIAWIIVIIVSKIIGK